MNSPYNNGRYQQNDKYQECFSNDPPLQMAKAQQNSGRYHEYFENDTPATKMQLSEVRSEAPFTPSNTENKVANM